MVGYSLQCVDDMSADESGFVFGSVFEVIGCRLSVPPRGVGVGSLHQ